jgi:hypothetical protein
VLAYIESYKGVKAGDRVWQLGFGSGFKVNSAVWVAKRRNNVSDASASSKPLLGDSTCTLCIGTYDICVYLTGCCMPTPSQVC